MKKFFSNKQGVLLALIVGVAYSVISFNMIRQEMGVNVSFSIWDYADRSYNLFYDDRNGEEYPFSDGFVKGTHIGIAEGKSTVSFTIPYGRANKLRLDIYANTPQEETIYFYDIKINSLGREATINAENIYKSFSAFPQSEVLIGEECVILNFDSDVVLFEALNDIEYSNVSWHWDKAYTLILVNFIILVIIFSAIFNVLIFLFNKLDDEKRKQILHGICIGFTCIGIILVIEIVQLESLSAVIFWIQNNYIYFLITFGVIFGMVDILSSVVGVFPATLFVGGISLLMTIISENKIKYRGAPFVPMDFALIREVNSIVSGLDLNLEVKHLIAFFILLVILLGILYITIVYKEKITIKNSPMKIISKIIVYVICVVLLFGREMGLPSTAGFDQVKDYETKGFVVGFLSNIKTIIIPKLDDYSEGDILAIVDGIKQSDLHKASMQPNIILIMSESLWDIEELPGIDYDREIFPNMNKLRNEALFGTLLTSVYGGGTGTTEFEVLTGFAKQFLPNEITPYYQLKSLLSNSSFSIASYLKSEGYSTLALHPFINTNYNRNVVYPNMGFDRYLSVDDFENPEISRSFISDKTLSEKIIEEYEKHRLNVNAPT